MLLKSFDEGFEDIEELIDATVDEFYTMFEEYLDSDSLDEILKRSFEEDKDYFVYELSTVNFNKSSKGNNAFPLLIKIGFLNSFSNYDRQQRVITIGVNTELALYFINNKKDALDSFNVFREKYNIISKRDLDYFKNIFYKLFNIDMIEKQVSFYIYEWVLEYIIPNIEDKDDVRFFSIKNQRKFISDFIDTRVLEASISRIKRQKELRGV